MMAGATGKSTRRRPLEDIACIALILFCWLLATVLADDLPEFLEQPQSQFVPESGSVILKCLATPEDAHVRWLFNGQPLDERRHKNLEVLGSNLRFSGLQRADVRGVSEGEYRCTATTDVGAVVSQPAVLSTPALLKFSSASNMTVTVPEGGYVTLTCDLPDSSPPASVLFLASGGELLDTSKSTVHRLPSGNLVLSNITSASAGDFRCMAVNPVSGDNVTSPAAISVIVDKMLSDKSATVNIIPGTRRRVEVEVGSEAVLECPSYGHPLAKITWSKLGGSLPVGRFNLSGFGNLRILSTQFEDSGIYKCSSSTDRKVEGQVLLETAIPPVVHVARESRGAVQIGSLVEMVCSVSGIPKPNLHWFHNGQEIAGHKGGKLTLAKVTAEDAGIYQCMATNKLGTAYGVTRLEVEGQLKQSSTHADKLPVTEDTGHAGVSSDGGRAADIRRKPGRRDRKKSGRRKRLKKNDRRRRKKKKSGHNGHRDKERPKYAPSVPTVAQLSDRSVMLNWSVPDKGNGQTVKFFKVQYKEMNPEKGPWRTSDAHITYNTRRFEVADLKSGGSYKFRILAVYEDDDNKNSANTPIFKLLVQPHAQARSPDTAPTIVEAKPIVYQQNFGIGVKWQYKAETASPIEGFIIFYKPFGANDDNEKLIPGAGIRNDVIRDLLPNTHYNIRMQSFNTVGRSQFSNQVVKTTKARDSSIVEDYPEPELPLKEPEDSTESPVSGRRSTDTLEHPIILGVVLGVLLLALLILVTMCWWKQRQQKRRSLAGNPQMKFQDQSQCIFADNTHTKPNGTLYPGNGGAPVTNGHVSHLESHRHMNIDVNPLSEYDMQTTVPGDCRAMLFYQSNGTVPRHSSDSAYMENKFQHKDSSSLHGCNGDIPYMLQQKPLYPMQHRSLPLTPNTFYSELSSAGLSVNHEYSEPRDRGLQTPEVIPSLCKQNVDHHGNNMGHMRNYDYGWSSYDQPRMGNSHFSSGERLSPLYSPVAVDFSSKPGFYQQHGKHHLPSLPSSPTSHVMTGTIPGCMGPRSQVSRGGVKHKKRRKRPHGQEHPAKEHCMKDQATNTDLSSNEGTLEFTTFCKSGSSSNSGSDVGGHHRDSSFANNGSLGSVSDDLHSSSSASGSEPDPHLLPGMPGSL